MHQRIIKGQRSIATRLVFGLATVVGCSLIYSLALGNAASATNFNPSLTLTTQAPVGKTNLRPGSDKDYSNYSVSVKIDSTDISNYSISVKANSSDMVGTTNKNNKLKSVPSGTAKTLNQMNNEWGYRWSIGTTASDDPLKDYSAMPTGLTDSTVVSNYNIGGSPGVSATRYFTLGFGATVNQTQPADTYTNKVTVSVVGEPITDTIFTISNMQDMYSDICDATTTPSASATRADTDGTHKGDTSYVPETTLTDTRDGTSYTIRKLADGNCWMSENLKLAMVEPGGSYASNSTTVLPDSFRLTNEDTDLDGVLTEWTPSIANKMFSISGIYKTVNTGTSYFPSDSISSYSNNGNIYYTHVAAMLGSDLTSDYSSKEITICPRGWTIASVGEMDFFNLFNAYKIGVLPPAPGYDVELSSSPSLFPLDFEFTGQYSGGVEGVGSYGSWWSDTYDYNPSRTISVEFSSDNQAHTVENNSNNYGYSVRCIAR